MHATQASKVLILGGSGFVGRHVCERLNRLGVHMSVLTRRVPAKSVQYLPYVDVIQGDVQDPKVLSAAMKGHSGVINLVARLHGTQVEFEELHEHLPQQIANACAEQGVKRLIHVSALGAEQSAPSQYLRTKARGEQALHNTATIKHLALTILRPSVIFGVDDQFINVFAQLQRRLPCIPLACSQAKFQPVWVQDVAQAIAYCVAHPQAAHKTYELGGPDTLTLRALVQFAGAWSGHPRPVFALPPLIAYVQARLMEALPGKTLMSRDNLLSMRVDNVLSNKLPGLRELGISRPQSLHAVFGLNQS